MAEAYRRQGRHFNPRGRTVVRLRSSEADELGEPTASGGFEEKPQGQPGQLCRAEL